jgi:putative glutamine amidotransferase
VKRPLIGVTISHSAQDREIFALRDDYVRSVEMAGGLPLVLAPGRAEDAPELIDHLDGLLLTGGADVDPGLYGEKAHETVTRVFPERDALELALCREALDRDLPLLAICRGHQVLNVATGGTLVQDLPSQWKGAMNHDPEGERWSAAHDVRILPGTRLREILGRERVAVNSFHHQAVKEAGQGAVIAAYSEGDDVVEAIEVPGRRLALGVQWHPEAFWDKDGRFRPLFEALVKASRR